MKNEDKLKLAKLRKEKHEQELSKQQHESEQKAKAAQEIEDQRFDKLGTRLEKGIKELADALQVDVSFPDIDPLLKKLDTLQGLPDTFTDIKNMSLALSSKMQKIADHFDKKQVVTVRGHQESLFVLKKIDGKVEKFTEIADYLEQLNTTLKQGQKPEDFKPVRLVVGGDGIPLRYLQDMPSSRGGGGGGSSSSGGLSQDDLNTSELAKEAKQDTQITEAQSTNTKLDTISGYLDTVETKLQAIADNTDSLEGYTDGLEALLTDIKGFVDGLETSLNNVDLNTDELEARIGEISATPTTNTVQDRLKSIKTVLDTISTNTDQLEGFTDGIEGLLTTLNGYVDQLEGYVDGLETLITSTNTKLDTVTTQQTDGTQRTKLTDGANNAAVVNAAPTTEYGVVTRNIPSGTQTVSGTVTANLAGTGSVVDNAAFTDGTTRVIPSGYILDETAGTALTENDAAAARIDSKRAQIATIEDATVRGRRAEVTSSNALKTDGSAVTQPVSAASLPLPTGASTSAKQDSIISELQDIETDLESAVTQLQNIDAGKLEEATFTGRIGEVSATPTANTVLERLKQIQTSVSSVATNTTDAATETTLTTVAGHLDTVETKLQSIIDNTDGLEGFVDGIEGLLTTLNGYVDQLEGYVDGLEGLITSTNTKLDTIASNQLPDGHNVTVDNTNSNPIPTTIANTVSTANSTTTPLTAGATWTGTFEEVSNYASISVLLKSDVASATNGTQIQFSDDGTNVKRTVAFTYTGGTNGEYFSIPVEAKYMRGRYINGGTNQANFTIHTILQTQQVGLGVAPVSVPLTDSNSVLVTKAILSGKQPDGDYVNERADGLALETSDTLLANATYTSDWVDTDGFRGIELFVDADVQSGADGVVVEFTDDSTVGTVRAQRTFTFNGDDIIAGFFVRRIPTMLDGFRVKYTNGGTNQSSFYLAATLRVNNSELSQAPVNTQISDTTAAVITRTGVYAENGSGQYGNIGRGTNGGLDVGIVEFEDDAPIKALTTAAVSQRSVLTTATRVDSSPLSNRKGIIVRAHSANNKKVYVGFGSGVTIGSGYELGEGQAIELDLTEAKEVWAIADTSTQTVSYIEVGE